MKTKTLKKGNKMEKIKITEEQVLEALSNCFDPEIPMVNVVDLGLIYDIKISDDNEVFVKMTLTAVGCPASGPMAYDAQQKILAIEGVKDAHVEIVWEPQWTPAMMTEEAKLMLGIPV
jgi:metal-sulfur cluster biosynthetic enzyme